MNLIPFLVGWIVLGLIVIVLLVSRIRLAKRADASLDVLESEREAKQQMEMTKKLERIDWWGQVLTVVVVLYGIILAGIHIYQVWQQTSKIQP
jgi:ABC-type Fe3+ transport system permease subunit